MRIAVLISCHNRKAKTLKCLEALFQNAIPQGSSLGVILVDDGSTDDTSREVQQRFPHVEVLHGDGSLFWNKAMHLAFAHAMEIGFDAYLWLNDDTLLYQDALQRLLGTLRQLDADTRKSAIVVGSTQDPNTGEITYGGVVKRGPLHPFSYSLMRPNELPVPCDTMNGNCVLVPDQVARRLGNLEPRFAHAMGDTDYGLRATAAGIGVWVAPGYVGQCARNPASGGFTDRSLPRLQRWKKMMQPKGLPPASWWVFTRRHGGPLWPLYWIWPYIKVML